MRDVSKYGLAGSLSGSVGASGDFGLGSIPSQEAAPVSMHIQRILEQLSAGGQTQTAWLKHLSTRKNRINDSVGDDQISSDQVQQQEDSVSTRPFSYRFEFNGKKFLRDQNNVLWIFNPQTGQWEVRD